MAVIKCPNCDGKGHVLNSLMLLCWMALPLAIFETNNKEGLTRQKCTHCNGTGFINKG